MELQTVIISKRIAKTPNQAMKIAKEKGYRMDTYRETMQSFRMRQRSSEDFKEGSFKTIHEGPYITLINGELK